MCGRMCDGLFDWVTAPPAVVHKRFFCCWQCSLRLHCQQQKQIELLEAAKPATKAD